MQVIKRDGKQEKFSIRKITTAVSKAYKACNMTSTREIQKKLKEEFSVLDGKDVVNVDDIHDLVENFLMKNNPDVAKAYIIHRDDHTKIKEFVKGKIDFINKYKKTKITADATVDDNSNVGGKNIGILNAEIHKEDNINVSRGMIMQKLKELFPDFDSKQYVNDLESKVIYKHDESSFSGAIAPYCCSITMYPFLTDGIKKIGGLSAKPKNLDSFCGMYVNLIFATSAQFAGAVATSEFLLYFDYFSRKEWGENYYEKADVEITNDHSMRPMTIKKKIHQHFQQVIYSLNQPAAARGLQSAFVNFSYFDKPFFDGMFGEFYFPDGTQPIWESLSWLQKEFMMWFNNERTKCILTFPVESFALVYKDGEFLDKDSAEFVAEHLQKEDGLDLTHINKAIKLFDYIANQLYKKIMDDGLNDICKKYMYHIFDEKVLTQDIDAFMYKYGWYPKHRSLVVPINSKLKRYYNDLPGLEKIIAKLDTND